MHIDVSLSALPGEENPDVLLGSKRESGRSSIKSSKINGENISGFFFGRAKLGKSYNYFYPTY